MAEFCEACALELGFPHGDFKGLTSKEEMRKGLASLVICEGCGPIQVDPLGRCISKDCNKSNKVGHGGNFKEER